MNANDTDRPVRRARPWWTDSRRRLALLLALLSVVARFGIPQILREVAATSASASPNCMADLHSEPRIVASDQDFVVQDEFRGGTWVRSDPCHARWYGFATRPPNGRAWYHRDSWVTVACARPGIAYDVTYPDGATTTWTTWLHVRGGGWFPAVDGWLAPRDSFSALPRC